MIPKHDEIRLPALNFLSDGIPRRPRDLEQPLAEHFGLTEEEVGRLYESGNGPKFFDRIGWALSYMNMAGLLDKPKRGIYQINERGRRLLTTPNELNEYIRQRMAERELEQAEGNDRSDAKDESQDDGASDLTPQERLYQSYENIRQSVVEEILDTILSKSPRAFEDLVVKVLQKMGYGGQVKGSGEVTQYTNDGGIDGVIREDVLGLGRIHIQAKRYARNNTVSREEIQKFVGALAVAQSKKGVFITTSSYSPGARDYAESLHGSTQVVLVDGQQLAAFIYDYGLGMQVEQTIEIRKLDGDFWDSMQDD